MKREPIIDPKSLFISVVLVICIAGFSAIALLAMLF